MIINDFDIFRSRFGPAKANPVLVIDPNAVLALTVTRQWLQSISGRYFKIIQSAGSLQLPQFPQRHPFEADKTPHTRAAK